MSLCVDVTTQRTQFSRPEFSTLVAMSGKPHNRAKSMQLSWLNKKCGPQNSCDTASNAFKLLAGSAVREKRVVSGPVVGVLCSSGS